MDLKEKFKVIFESGYSFKIENIVKRFDGEWENRIIWTRQQLPAGQTISTCRWEGFEDIESCVNDILVYLKNPS
jgi:hypothetical protein